ncbi:PREDICTED: phosphoglucan phosphatase LSF1, chloroplastic [Fragaria vesca subsp. vesca]|uniref:phosphoglucan phosphatase LSF1, chloroplastic n=1 Tax=Fragaria vesca subsp. vesca TaxID=101020 RepID=UPI0002C36F74|nr:PREDICTED: phosphoglucan phosphatase LSF1, chloroplastic [Fragaria vesca subsp. vesca]
MFTLQILPSCRAPDRSPPPPSLLCGGGASSFWGTTTTAVDFSGGSREEKKKLLLRRRTVRIVAMSSSSSNTFKMNLNEYMVTLEKPLGIRFALSVDGKIFVHALKKGGNAEKSRIVMVGDTLKKAGSSSDERLSEIKDFGDTQKMLKEKAGSYSLVLERPFSPFPIQQLLLMNDLDNLFNRGRVPFATWNNSVLASNLQSTAGSSGSSGFVTFSSKFLKPQGWNSLIGNGHVQAKVQRNTTAQPISQLVCILSEEEPGDGEWAYGNFPLEEYIKALDRSKGELYYDHSLGMRYSKITEQIYVGSCIQTEDDVKALSNAAGITAVLNFQTGTETQNWGINSNSINESCQKFDILMINYPIRDGDSFDLRKKLPFCVGLLLRLLKKNHRVYVTCTSGFDRSPTCVIAYLHWMTDTSLHAAYNFVTGLHLCRPDRPAIAWATWDLIAMVENGKHDGPATHAVTFVWNGQEGENVNLVGDFTNNWKEPIQLNHKGGSRWELEVRLSQGKYYYKFIVNDQWRHSTSSPAERDDSGNVNNVIIIGDTASVRPSVQQQKKDANIIKVIERPLTENERFMLAKAARCVAFSICPIRLAPK